MLKNRGLILILLSIVVGVILIKTSASKEKSPTMKSQHMETAVVEVLTMQKQTWIPKLKIFGTVQPHNYFQAVAEVSGRIEWIHPQFQGGAILSSNELLIKIDSTDYELDLGGARSGIKEINQKIIELNQQEEQLKAMIELDKKSLNLALKEFERQTTLQAKGSTTQSVKDQSEQAYLAVQTRLLQKQNELESIPTRKEVLKATLEKQNHSVSKFSRIVEKTSFRLPFEGRIRKSNLVVGQFVQAGQILFEADGTSRVELRAQISPRNMKVLLGGMEHQVTWSGTDMGNLVARLKWKATAKFVGTKFSHRWNANLNRIDGVIDPATRTLGLVFTVEEPWQDLILGEKPPLIVGAHVEIDLEGLSHEDVFVIPRRALHDSYVYLCDSDSKLKFQDINTDFEHQDVAIVKQGLDPGSKLVLTDLFPAIASQRITCIERAGQSL